jgi:hypothetical protein
MGNPAKKGWVMDEGKRMLIGARRRNEERERMGVCGKKSQNGSGTKYIFWQIVAMSYLLGIL